MILLMIPSRPALYRSLTFLTHVSTVAGQTQADEGVHLIDAGASVLTWVGQTVVYIYEKTEALVLVRGEHRDWDPVGPSEKNLSHKMIILNNI